MALFIFVVGFVGDKPLGVKLGTFFVCKCVGLMNIEIDGA